jgi:hypothetical protein
VPRSDAQGHMSAVDRCLVCNGSGYLPAADLAGYDHRAGSDEDYIEPLHIGDVFGTDSNNPER